MVDIPQLLATVPVRRLPKLPDMHDIPPVDSADGDSSCLVEVTHLDPRDTLEDKSIGNCTSAGASSSQLAIGSLGPQKDSLKNQSCLLEVVLEYVVKYGCICL